MEEKNNQNKITFGTYIIIVTIVFLVLLVGILTGILIQKNKEENVTNINENLVSNTESNKEENNVKEDEFNNMIKNEEEKMTKENEKVTEILNKIRDEDTNYEELRVEKISYKNNEYKINIKYVNPITISKKEYKTMKTQGYIKINNEKYNFYNDNEQYENGTVVNKENIEYEVIQYNEKYAFNLTGLAGSGISLLNNIEEFIIDVDKDTKIYDCFENKEYKLKDSESKTWLNKSLEDTLVYLQYDENDDFMIYISNK